MRGSEMSEVRFGGYFPGVVGKITELHGVYYYEDWGFDVSFETQVGRELSEYMDNFEENRDGFWVATIRGEFAGSITIDGSQAGNKGARLRWFIVPPISQGRGIGRLLIGQAIDFCRKANYKKVCLWTFEGLDVARYLYEREGFHLSKEREVRQWGQEIKEQMFELDL